MVALEREIETYKKRLPELSANEGKFALISGEEVVGLYDSYNDALATGYEKLGLAQPFLVKQISSVETLASFTRELEPGCPT